MQVIIIYGPTAVGKSAIAVELAKMINGEIISADSMQIYKKLDIGSAKITKEEMQGISHHLIDILEPNEDYSASEFCKNCVNLIYDIIARNKTPIIVGGTGLYIKGLLEGYNFGSSPKNEEFRKSLEHFSNDEIYSKIKSLNNNCVVDKNNRRRLIRTLERLTFGYDSSNTKSEFNFKLFAVVDDRLKIYERINKRVDNMIKCGLLDEAKYLLNLNLSEDNLCMKAIGYKELFPYLLNKDTLDNCKEILKQKTRNYAKRQFTFMNQFDNLIKIQFCGIKETADAILKVIKEDK